MENLENQEYSKDKGSKRVLRLKGFTVEIRDNVFKYFPTNSNEHYYIISKSVTPQSGYRYLDMIFKDRDTDKIILDSETLKDTLRSFIWDITDRNGTKSDKLLGSYSIVKDEATNDYSLRLPNCSNEELLRHKVTTVKIPRSHPVIITPVEYKHFRVSSLFVNSNAVSLELVSYLITVLLNYSKETGTWSIENISFRDDDLSLPAVYYVEELDRALSKFRLENHFLWLSIDDSLKRYEEKFQASLKETFKIDPSGNEIREEKILLFSVVNRILEKAGRDYADYKIIYNKG